MPAAAYARRTKVEQSTPSRPPGLPTSALAADRMRATGSGGAASAGERAGGRSWTAVGAGVDSATGIATGSAEGASRCSERDEAQAAASAISAETRVRHGLGLGGGRIEGSPVCRESASKLAAAT